jgi:hypothetical protein
VNWFDLNIDAKDSYISNRVDILIAFNAENVDKSIDSIKEE